MEFASEGSEMHPRFSDAVARFESPRNICSIEREDSRDRGRVSGPGGGGRLGGNGNSNSSGGGGGGAATKLLSAGNLGQTSQLSRPTPKSTKDSLDNKAGISQRTDATGGGAGTNALSGPTITRTATTPMSPMDLAAAQTAPSDDDTYDNTGRLKTVGTSPYVSDPSIGQIAGALTSAAPVAGSVNAAVGAGEDMADGGGFGDTYDGGAIGRFIDGMRGVQPGQVTGNAGNQVASNTDTRGDRPSDGGPNDDTRLLDRASSDATDALTGGTGAGTAALFSDVQLQDRRKPRTMGAGTSMLLKAA